MTGISNQSQNQNNGKVITDPAFQAIPKNKPFLLIWRVENLQLVPVPKDSYGTFFKGDTYLVASNTDAANNKIGTQHIHLWIGSDSTTDEQGVGAFKMVELDDYLSSAPIQHRECQNFESERFLSYFKKGIKYQNGGIASGFHHYEKKFEPRLFQLKGKRTVRLIELKNIEWASLNRTDSFLVDLNLTIFIWNGKHANKFEKLQAINKARLFKDERNGQCNIVIAEDGEEKEMCKEELALFESKFPLKDKLSKLKNDPPLCSMDDQKFERELVTYLKLYKCSDAHDDEDGTVKIKIIEQKTGPLYKEDLNSEDSFIIDNGKAGIWVWIGRKSGVKERQEAMRNALGFLQAKGFDERQQNSIKITRVIDGSEPVEFRALFNRWVDQNDQKGLGKTHTINKVAKKITTNFDASLLHFNSKLAAETQMIDDGKGFKQVWLVKNFEIHQMPDVDYGRFHHKNCYIIHYSYHLEQAKKNILYYWIGRKSSTEDQGTVVLKTIEIDNKMLNGNALQVRVVESKEPNHFMSMFDGRIIIYQNEYMSSNQNKLKDYMLQVKSYGNLNIKAVQVEYKAASLNSNDVFIICSNKENFYIWCGRGSTGDEREAAKSLVLDLKQEPQVVIESQEKEEFWYALGGKQPYFNAKQSNKDATHSHQPIARLFEVSNASGKLTVNEIYQFGQADLNASEIMLLDAWEAVFIWIGSQAIKSELEAAVKIAHDYLRTDPSQRGIDIPIFKVKQGQEPPNFTGFFGPWDPNGLKADFDYNEIKSDVQSKNQPHLFQQATKSKLNKLGKKGFNEVEKFSYAELIKPADELPESVDNATREFYLNEDEFVRVFKMTFEQFLEKPAWKQKELKKAVHLF